MITMLQMEMATTPVFLPGKFHGQSLAGYSPQSHKELDMTEASQHTGMQKHHTRNPRCGGSIRRNPSGSMRHGRIPPSNWKWARQKIGTGWTSAK